MDLIEILIKNLPADIETRNKKTLENINGKYLWFSEFSSKFYGTLTRKNSDKKPDTIVKINWRFNDKLIDYLKTEPDPKKMGLNLEIFPSSLNPDYEISSIKGHLIYHTSKFKLDQLKFLNRGSLEKYQIFTSCDKESLRPHF